MFRDTHFEYEVLETPHGTRIGVTHMPSGKTKTAELVLGEVVGHVRERLRKEIENELCSPDQFHTRTLRSKGQTVITVTHKPSRKSRQAVVEKENAFQTKIKLIDEILLELTQEQSP